MPNGDADLDIGGNHSNSDDDLGDDFDCNDKRDDEELCKFCYQNPKRVKMYGFCSMPNSGIKLLSDLQCRKAKKEATTYIKKKKKKKQPASSTTSSSTSTGSASTLSSLTTRSSEPPHQKKQSTHFGK